MSHKVKWLRPLSPHCVKRDPNVSINDLKIPINVRQYHWRMHLLPLLPLIGGPLILSGCFLLRDISVVKSFFFNTGFLSLANGEKLLLKTSDNEKFLAEVDGQKSATAKLHNS